MRPINEVIVHCTATRPKWWEGKSTSEKVAEIRRWHTQDRDWSDIGYHYLIDRDGTIAAGRPITRTGAHVKGKNTGTIGVALFGGHGSNENDKFAENYTPEQDRALRDLLKDMQAKYSIERITGHNKYAAKACPGFTVSEWLAEDAEKTPTQAPKADPAPTPEEQPQGLLAALISALLSIFGGKK